MDGGFFVKSDRLGCTKMGQIDAWGESQQLGDADMI